MACRRGSSWTFRRKRHNQPMLSGPVFRQYTGENPSFNPHHPPTYKRVTFDERFFYAPPEFFLERPCKRFRGIYGPGFEPSLALSFGHCGSTSLSRLLPRPTLYPFGNLV